MFAMLIDNVFEIVGRGVVLSGHYDAERYELGENTCLYDMMGNEFVVSGIEMFRRAGVTYTDLKNYPIGILLKDLKCQDKNYFVGKLLTMQYDFQFKELDGAAVAENITAFKLPNGFVTITDSDGVKIPFSVERQCSCSVLRYMDNSGERLLKKFSTVNLYRLYFDLPPEKDKVYHAVFSGGSLPKCGGDEFTFSIAGVVGNYAVGTASFDTESDLCHGFDKKKYDVQINDSKTGFELRPLLNEPVKAWLNIAWVESDGFPEGSVEAVEYWVN